MANVRVYLSKASNSRVGNIQFRYIPENVINLQKYLQEALDYTPEEHRGTLQLEPVTYYEPYCEEKSSGFDLYYDRPETPQETEDREAREEYIRKERVAREKEQLAALKAKYKKL